MAADSFAGRSWPLHARPGCALACLFKYFPLRGAVRYGAINSPLGVSLLV